MDDSLLIAEKEINKKSAVIDSLDFKINKPSISFKTSIGFFSESDDYNKYTLDFTNTSEVPIRINYVKIVADQEASSFFNLHDINSGIVNFYSDANFIIVPEGFSYKGQIIPTNEMRRLQTVTIYKDRESILNDFFKNIKKIEFLVCCCTLDNSICVEYSSITGDQNTICD